MDNNQNPFKGPKTIKYSTPLNCHLLKSVSELLIPSYDLRRLIIVDAIPTTVELNEVEDLIRQTACIILSDRPTNLTKHNSKIIYFMTDNTQITIKISQLPEIQMFMKFTGIRIYSAKNPQLEMCQHKGWPIFRYNILDSRIKPTTKSHNVTTIAKIENPKVAANDDEWDDPIDVSTKKKQKTNHDDDVLSLHADDALEVNVPDNKLNDNTAQLNTSSELELKSKEGQVVLQLPVAKLSNESIKLKIDETIPRTGERITGQIELYVNPILSVEFRIKATTLNAKVKEKIS
jgi:hypothetical protein